MRITASDVSLASSRISIATSTVKEHLRQWDTSGEQTYDAEKFNGKLFAGASNPKDIAQFQQLRPRPFTAALPQPPLPANQQQNSLTKGIKDEFVGDIKSQIMKDVIEAFFGKKIDVLDPEDLNRTDSADSATDPATAADQGWGIDYSYKETRYTKEGVAFSASGTVTTADGSTINFTASLEMSRETYDEINISLKAGDALKDPLVIDLSGAGATFTNTKFDFDIDSNGASRQLYAPKTGTGFLAYDRNGNGLIDNGSELFGPQSGNGFSELALLDEDKNGWIDENDPAFNSMKIWQKDAADTDNISSLLQSGVGAIYTGKAATSYNLANNAGNLAGVLRESGVYLKENGGAGVVQEVDLVV